MPYCTRFDYSPPLGLGPGGGAWAGVLPGPRMCQRGRADVSSLAGDVFTFSGNVFSFPANVFTFRPNVFSFPGDVFSYRGHVFSFRRRAASRYGRLRADEHPRCVRSIGVGRQGIRRPRALTPRSKASRGWECGGGLGLEDEVGDLLGLVDGFLAAWRSASSASSDG